MTENNLAGRHIAVVGAGIVGASCAAQLCLQGAKVTIIDRALPGMAGPSRGNAAHIAAPEIIPMATPGIILSAFGMLLDKSSPLKIPLSQWPFLLPWLLRFALNSTKATHYANIEKLAEINSSVFSDVEQLFAKVGLSEQLHKDGALYLYESESSLANAADEFAIRAKYGYQSELLSAEQIYALEPNLAKIFAGGYRLPQWMSVSDPKKVVSELVKFCVKQGAEFVCEEVLQMSKSSKTAAKNVTLHFNNGGVQHFDKVVLSAGVFSKPLLNKLGTPKVVEAERGYNLTYTDPQMSLARAVLFGDRGVVATPLDHGIRIGGWAEFGGIKRRASEKHFAAIDNIAAQLFPQMQRQQHYRWMGHRPSTPDSLPIIERSAANEHIVYALGHGHLGLTQGPTTAKMVASLM